MSEPARTCVGCRKVRSKSVMVRLVRAAPGTVSVDPTGVASGRGAYVCDTKCLADARGRLGRALKADGVNVEALREAVARAEEGT